MLKRRERFEQGWGKASFLQGFAETLPASQILPMDTFAWCEIVAKGFNYVID